MQKKSVSGADLREKILGLIYQALDEVDEGSGKEPLIKSPETVLLGSQSGLDSLKLVNLIVAVEQRVEEQFGFAISAIANEKAMSQKSSPLRNCGTLADFIASILTEAGK